MYRPSEKVQTLSAPAKNLGPEFHAGEVSHELARCKSILRNSRATEFDRIVATQRIHELGGKL
jgi:hypothetical protein